MTSTKLSPGEQALRRENIQKRVTNISATRYIIKKAIPEIKSSNAEEESYYRESAIALGALAKLPRDASFPMDTPSHQKFTAYQQQWGIDTIIPWRDARLNNIDHIARALFRLSNRITALVDAHVWDIVSESQSAAHINSVAAGATWDNATRGNRIPHEDIAKAIRLVEDSELQSYTADTIMVNPYDKAFLLSNDYVLASFDASGPNVMKNGNFGQIMGLTLLSTPVVTDDYAGVCQSKMVSSFAQALPLTTYRDDDPGKHFKIRATEIGVSYLTDPKAMCLITNTNS